MLRLTHFGLAACLGFTFACGPFPTEAATTEGSEGSESGPTTTAESESGSASMSGDGDGDSGDGDGDGDSGDGDGDGDSGDGDGDGDSGDGDTGDGDGDGDSGDGDTGDGDGDNTGDGDGDGDDDNTGDGDGDNTGDGDGDTTGDGDGDGGQDYYGDCSMGNMCLNDEYCFEDNSDDYQVCSQNCNDEGDCPNVPEHSLKCILLNFNFAQKRCFISCEDNEACPMGMDCQAENLGIDYICVYPQP